MGIESRILRNIASACTVAALALTPARATQVRLVNLEEMTSRAERIFSGRCLAVEVAHDFELGNDVTVATFEGHRTVKGSADRTVTIRMGVGDSTRGGGTPGVPSFHAGDEVVLFLYGPSQAGLTSPVGLGQGRFRVVEDKQGRRIAVNDFANRNLLRGLTPGAEARLRATIESATPTAGIVPETLLDMAGALAASGP